jgi:hypothetical protein
MHAAFHVRAGTTLIARAVYSPLGTKGTGTMTTLNGLHAPRSLRFRADARRRRPRLASTTHA